MAFEHACRRGRCIGGSRRIEPSEPRAGCAGHWLLAPRRHRSRRRAARARPRSGAGARDLEFLWIDGVRVRAVRAVAARRDVLPVGRRRPGLALRSGQALRRGRDCFARRARPTRRSRAPRSGRQQAAALRVGRSLPRGSRLERASHGGLSRYRRIVRCTRGARGTSSYADARHGFADGPIELDIGGGRVSAGRAPSQGRQSRRGGKCLRGGAGRGALAGSVRQSFGRASPSERVGP